MLVSRCVSCNALFNDVDKQSKYRGGWFCCIFHPKWNLIHTMINITPCYIWIFKQCFGRWGIMFQSRNFPKVDFYRRMSAWNSMHVYAWCLVIDSVGGRCVSVCMIQDFVLCWAITNHMICYQTLESNWGLEQFRLQYEWHTPCVLELNIWVCNVQTNVDLNQQGMWCLSLEVQQTRCWKLPIVHRKNEIHAHDGLLSGN